MGKKRKLSRNLRTSKRLDCLTREGETRCYPKYWTLIFNANVIVCFLHDARSEVVWLCFSDLAIITTALNFQPNTIGCMEYQILRHYKKKNNLFVLEFVPSWSCSVTHHFNELFHGLLFGYGFTPAAILGIVVPEQISVHLLCNVNASLTFVARSTQDYFFQEHLMSKVYTFGHLVQQRKKT